MTEFRKLLLDDARIQVQFRLNGHAEDLGQISTTIQNLLAEKDWPVAREYIVQSILNARQSAGVPLEYALFVVEADPAAKAFTCRAHAAEGNAPAGVVP